MIAELMGEGNYYLELQDHGIPAQQTVLEGLLQIHRETGIPLVATNDAHYLTRADAKSQDVLMCIQMGRRWTTPTGCQFETEEFYIKSREEMEAWCKDFPEALDNTGRIADRCNMTFRFGEHHLPEFQYPEGYDGETLFAELCEKGFRKRYPHGSEAYRQRLHYEMDMIRKWGLWTTF